MPDHVWDRFKRTFGAEDSTALTQVRVNKINTALGRMDTAATSMDDRGLDTTLMRQALQGLRARRDTAVQTLVGSALGTSLQEIKRDAREAADGAEITSREAISQLDTELETHRQRIESALGKVAWVRLPLAVSLLATPKQQLEAARDNAENEPTDHRKRTALALVDSSAVTDLLATTFAANRDHKTITSRLARIKSDIEELPEGSQRSRFLLECTQVQHAQDQIDRMVDVQQAATRAAEVLRTATELVGRTSPASSAHLHLVLSIQQEQRRIQTAIDRAESAGSKLGKATVATAVQQVKQQRDTALQQAELSNQLEALRRVSVDGLVGVIAVMRDLEQGVPALMAGIAKVIEDVENVEKKDRFTERLVALQLRLDAANDEDDAPTAKRLFLALKTDAKVLMDEAIKHGGKDAYRTALKERFGVDVIIDEGSIVSLEKTYRMMEVVPESHVAQEKVNKVHFTKKDPGEGAFGMYTASTTEIEMSGIKTQSRDSYVLNGHKHSPNEFNVTMLHEIGHAVDDKFQVMNNLLDTTGYGGWRKETRESVVAAIAAKAVSEMGTVDQPLQQAVETAVSDSLDGTKVTRPEGTSRTQWKTLQTYLRTARTVRADAKPWFNGSITKYHIDGRVYLQSYKKSWSSFQASERRSQRVNDYQWRAPGEWFAEIYAICWMTNKEKPSGVGPALERWLPEA